MARAMQPKRSVPRRKRTAFHEAGHAVLSAAINDAPHHVSIRPGGLSLGRARYALDGRPEWLVQVFLAGFASEQVLTGKRPKALDAEVARAITALEPNLGFVAAGWETCDGYFAVQKIVSMQGVQDRERICAEIDRFLAIAGQSLRAVWPAVEAVARALLLREGLDSGDFFAAIEGVNLYEPVLAVQSEHGLLRRRAAAVAADVEVADLVVAAPRRRPSE